VSPVFLALVAISKTKKLFQRGDSFAAYTFNLTLAIRQIKCFCFHASPIGVCCGVFGSNPGAFYTAHPI